MWLPIGRSFSRGLFSSIFKGYFGFREGYIWLFEFFQWQVRRFNMPVPWIRHGFLKGDVKDCKEVVGFRFGDVFGVGIF